MATVLATPSSSVWRTPLFILAAAINGILILFARDVTDMAGLWWGVSTYQHCLYIVPIIGWLLWQRGPEVGEASQPAGWLPGLGLVFAAAVVWLLGEAGGVALVRHIGVVLIVQATVVAVLGPAVVRAVLFPLAYLIFLVPFGDEFVAPMQTLTARMTMALLGATGVPATIDGIFITTRAGWFEVAEACAGVKFLVAMVAYATLAANVCFRSWTRRALFMAFAVTLPILANGVRAWGTIFAAEYVGIERATGLDHLIYGWVFFAAVMLIIMGAAWPFFDRRLGEPWLGGQRFAPWRPTAPVALAGVLAVAAAALPMGWDAFASAAGRSTLQGSPTLPMQVGGWTRTGDAPAQPWSPQFDGADHRLYARYGDAQGRRVDVAVALYGWQAHGREIVGFGQGVAKPWTWAADLPSIAGGRTERQLAPGAATRTTVTFWQVGNTLHANRASVKLATLSARLIGGDQRAATLIVSAESTTSPAAVNAFLAALGDPGPRLTTMLTEAQAR